ncbi:MAG TPA: choice-of-anchor tandem repeat GloVer-containing protein [Terriglobia bacterium]|nr:choice-of-anchor tandem repeat GloVer-containing protein [Terriglobia bacterium]
MKSRMITGTGIALFAVVSVVTGLGAQEQEAGQNASRVVFKTLLTLDNADGSPWAGLVQGTDGNLYGDSFGGTDGIVFKITPQGKLTTIHNFDGTDGNGPQTALVLATDGNFYGTTYFGGPDPNACNGTGCGTVFKITPAGALTVLHSFDGSCTQTTDCPGGAGPGALVQGSDGNFYGTTYLGGTCYDGCGTVFKITPNGVLTTLYDFSSSNDGGYSPYYLAGLVQGTDGNLYGTTTQGGSCTRFGGCGTVFKITPQGALTTLHSFTGTGAEGWGPGGTLIEATDGNFYGTTGGGGSSQSCAPFSCGTVFKITPQGTFTTLTSLTFPVGWGPSGLVQGTDGNFYGTGANGGGPGNYGTVFEITPEGVLTRLHSFNNSGGDTPVAGLVQATNGTFYGTTLKSETGYGTVYSVSVGLGPFIKSVPTAGKTGTAVKILGNNLALATGVTFNGVVATFTVESSTYLKTTVPTGATTGQVQVTLPSGTLTSNVNFQVLP